MGRWVFVLENAGLAFVIAVLTAPLIIKKLNKLHMGQKILEDGPTWHMSKQNTPTMGGLIFIAAMSVPVLLSIPSMLETGDWRPLLMLSLSLIFGVIGFIDDYTKKRRDRNKGISAKQKLLLQIAAAVLFLTVMRVMGYMTPALYIPFARVSVELPWAAYLLISTFIIVGTDNAVNLTDGIDGLCSSVTFIVAVFFSVMFMLRDSSSAIFSLALAGALLGFFFFNKHPARVFMGDTGSLFLGGAVCAMAFSLEMPLILALVGFVYMAEAVSDIIQVIYFKLTGGKRFFKMAPLHHHLEMSGWSEWKIVGAAVTLTAAMCLLSYAA